MLTFDQYVQESIPDITVRIKRPNGQIETVEVPENLRRGSTEIGFKHRIFPNIVRQTKAAGRGDVLDYQYTEKKIVPTTNRELHCTRCGVKVTNKPKTLAGNFKLGSSNVKTQDPYCDSCYQLLKTMEY